MKWTNTLVDRAFNLRRSGMMFGKIASTLREETGDETITASAVNNALRYYLDEVRFDEMASADVVLEKRRAQNRARKDRKNLTALLDANLQHSCILEAITLAADRISKAKPVKITETKGKAGTHMTAELLLSDLQMGKLMPNYNTEIARKRLAAYTEAAIFKIKQHQKSGYVFDKIVLAILGDIIESDEKHQSSARSCDSGTAEQLANVQEAIFMLVIEPLARLGIPMDVVCVTGNHDWNQSGLNMYKPGLVHLSWPMYNALRMFTEFRGYSHVQFHIPQGCFHIHNIYGHNVLYEHGVGVSTSEASLKNRRQQRTQQTRKMITYFRMGDKHNISRFNEDTLVVNGAFFGSDTEGTEYSGIAGYESDAGQIMFFHVPRKDDRRLTIYDSFVIQLAHIT